MSKLVKCPICHSITDVTNTNTCGYCGQCLKMDSQNEVRWENGDKSKTKPKPKKSGYLCECFTILIILLGIFLLFGYFQGGSHKKDVATSIDVINDHVDVTINQNDQFSMPTSVVVKMDNGKGKTVKVTWDKSSDIDTTVPGIQVFNGKVEGDDNPIKYTINILKSTNTNEIGDTVTYNSIIKYNVKFYDKTKWAWFKVSKKDEVSDQIIPVQNGVMRGNLYLSFGPGEYNVKMLTSSSDEKQGYFNEIKNYIIENQDKRDMKYLMPSEYIESNSPEIIKLSNEIIKECYSDMEKTRAIHDWVATNIAYDVEVLYNNNIREYSAIDTLSGKKAICNGYANLTAALNRAIGIKTKIIHGRARSENSDIYLGHAWNEIYIDGKWIIQDTTWDAGGISDNRKFIFQLDHKYFDPNLNVFKETHIKEAEKED